MCCLPASLKSGRRESTQCKLLLETCVIFSLGYSSQIEVTRAWVKATAVPFARAMTMRKKRREKTWGRRLGVRVPMTLGYVTKASTGPSWVTLIREILHFCEEAQNSENGHGCEDTPGYVCDAHNEGVTNEGELGI